MRVDSSSSRSQVNDPLRPAQWIGGRRSDWSYDAEVLSLWWYGQRRQPHGVHWKTYVHTTMPLVFVHRTGCTYCRCNLLFVICQLPYTASVDGLGSRRNGRKWTRLHFNLGGRDYSECNANILHWCLRGAEWFTLVIPIVCKMCAIVYDWPLDLNTSSPVTLYVGNLPWNFERCTVFSFRVNGWYGTDGQTEGREVTRSAAY